MWFIANLLTWLLHLLTLIQSVLLAFPHFFSVHFNAVQEAEQDEVKAVGEAQVPRSAKKSKSLTSTPQMGSAKKEKKGKHKGQLIDHACHNAR